MSSNTPRRPRWKDYAQLAWCLATDWLSAVSVLHRSAYPGLASWIGERAQVGWFIAHNNRIYNWLDAEPELVVREVPEDLGPAFAEYADESQKIAHEFMPPRPTHWELVELLADSLKDSVGAHVNWRELAESLASQIESFPHEP